MQDNGLFLNATKSLEATIMTEEERRQFTRFPFDGLVSFEYQGTNYQCELIDISLQGALLETKENWVLGRVQDLDFDLQLNDHAVEVKFKGSIVHVKDEQIGINCEHIDIDSASHLKRLVELNLGDSLLLARELSAMC